MSLRDEVRVAELIKDEFQAAAQRWRGINPQQACPSCCGTGIRNYPRTSTVCDRCWGGGDHEKPWRAWLAIEQIKEVMMKIITEEHHADTRAA